MILVVRAGETYRNSLKVSIENIEASGVNLLGLVINDINEKSSNYYYYYYYYYYTSEGQKKRKKRKK